MMVKWGDICLILLCISVISGVFVALQYEYSTPLYSTIALDTIVPFGAFFRSVHFFSSQLAFLLGCLHMIVAYRASGRYSRLEWSKLIASLPVLLLLLFTGYILRGDATGNSAGAIAEHILDLVPIAGHWLNSLFFSISESGLRKVYVAHVAGLDIALLFLLWRHLRQFRVLFSQYLIPTTLIFCFCAAVNAPFEPHTRSEDYISGPWFFLGLQELLRYIHPLVAGFILPISFLAILWKIRPSPDKRPYVSRLILGLIFTLLVYAILTIIAWLR